MYSEIEKIRKVFDVHNLGLHLDGARIWNALVSKKENPKDYGKIFDTISVCLSKGLGTPMGSVLIGKEEIMKKLLANTEILPQTTLSFNLKLDASMLDLLELHRRAH